jgi:hypothetical protein
MESAERHETTRKKNSNSGAGSGRRLQTKQTFWHCDDRGPSARIESRLKKSVICTLPELNDAKLPLLGRVCQTKSSPRFHFVSAACSAARRILRRGKEKSPREKVFRAGKNIAKLMQSCSASGTER